MRRIVEHPVRTAVWAVLALVGAAVLLAGCTAGSPGLVEDPATGPPREQAAIAAPTNAQPANAVVATRTATPAPTVAPPPTATATTEPTEEPTARPTRTPKPKRTPTPRPDPPQPDDPAVSQVYERGTSGRPEIALTFDAGSDRGYAETILDTLKAYRVKASFAITGQWAEENPDLVKRMGREGHMIINHSWSHRSFLPDSPSDPETVTESDARSKELDDTAEAIADAAGGYDVRPYFRPPYGEYDAAVLRDLASDGYTVMVMWSCDTLGWNGASAHEIIGRCGSDAQPGDIILMHVGSASLDAEALPQLIETLQGQGYELVTVEELLQP